MKYQYSVVILGVIVILFPFLHFPSSWETIFLIIIGLFIISTGIVIHQHRAPHKKNTHVSVVLPDSSLENIENDIDLAIKNPLPSEAPKTIRRVVR